MMAYMRDGVCAMAPLGCAWRRGAAARLLPVCALVQTVRWCRLASAAPTDLPEEHHEQRIDDLLQHKEQRVDEARVGLGDAGREGDKEE